jgi:hypothetical protein
MEVSKVNISSINNNWSLYSTYLNNASTSTSSSQASSDVSETQNIISNADGDTFELSGNTQNVSQNLTYGPPRGPGGPGGPPPASGEGDEIKDFLDKVADGTVTEEDITNMQSLLQEAQKSFSSNNVNFDDSQNTGSDPIKSFLDKVANGTVTDEDITNMQTILQQMQQQYNS